MQVKNKDGKEFTVSEQYFKDYSHKLEVVKATTKKPKKAATPEKKAE